MKTRKASQAIYLDNRRARMDNTYPLTLRITFERQRKYYGIGRHVKQEEWRILRTGKPRGPLKLLQMELYEIERKAQAVIEYLEDKGEEFSFVRFENEYFGSNEYPSEVAKAFDLEIKVFYDAGQISSAESYTCAERSLFAFLRNRRYKFKDIDEVLLKKYEKWMLANGKSISTVGIYMRNIRKLYKKALKENIIKLEQYPFGNTKYVIPLCETSDRGLPKEVIKKLFYYKPEELSEEDKAKDLWFFMYLCNGMNVKDICLLKVSCIQMDKLVFRRAKTKTTAKRARNITVLLNPEIIRIIEKWRTGVQPDEYLFPFLYNGITPKDERRIVQNLYGVINDWMKRICQKLNIPFKVTTYSARHSYSNILKDAGAPIKLIADSLGHSTVTITEQHYLGEYDVKTRKEYANQLLNFNS